jgi:hypothetical protein
LKINELIFNGLLWLLKIFSPGFCIFSVFSQFKQTLIYIYKAPRLQNPLATRACLCVIMNTEPTVKEMLHKMVEGKFSSLDMHNLVEQLTGSNPYKISLLERDLEMLIAEEEQNRKVRAEACVTFSSILQNIKQNASSIKKKLSQSQIALLCFYEGVVITRANAGEIAARYGHASGNRLYNCYTRLINRQNRMGGAEEGRKFRNRIELIQSVIPLLEHNKNAQQQAEKESVEMMAKEAAYD